jgi:hypothetical protein
MVALNANINDDLIFQTAGFNTIRLDAAGTLQLIGGTLETNAGNIELSVDGLALFAIDGAGRQVVLQIVSGTPCFMNAGSFRIATLGQATTDMDAVPLTKIWTDYTPTLVWGTATPAALTVYGRYCQIGKIVFFKLYISSADSNACTSLTATLPVMPSNDGSNRYAVAAIQQYGASGTTYIDPLAYISNTGAEQRLRFFSFQTATDGQIIAIFAQGQYEVA